MTAKVRWWKPGCLAIWPPTITSCAGQVLSLVLSSVRQLTKPWRAASVFEPPNVWELWRPEREKKRQWSFFCFFKKSLEPYLKPWSIGMVGCWGTKGVNSQSPWVCGGGGLHPSCPLFSLVGAHLTCWLVLLGRGEVNARDFSHALH